MRPPSSPTFAQGDLFAQVALDVLGHDADGGHGLFQLGRGDIEVPGPVAQFPIFVDIDADSVGRTALFQIICH